MNTCHWIWDWAVSGSRLENGKETENFLEIYIWKNNDSYCKEAKHLVKLSPAITWKIKNCTPPNCRLVAVFLAYEMYWKKYIDIEDLQYFWEICLANVLKCRTENEWSCWNYKTFGLLTIYKQETVWESGSTSVKCIRNKVFLRNGQRGWLGKKDIQEGRTANQEKKGTGEPLQEAELGYYQRPLPISRRGVPGNIFQMRLQNFID